jgi:hypothetical protein
MAEDKVEPREVNWRQLLPWTVLFQGFRVALDPNKLVLAAAGILLMALGWWVLAIIFDYKKPDASEYTGNLNNYPGANDDEKKTNAWKEFKTARDKWDVMHRVAATAFPDEKERDQFAYDAGDLADSWQEYERLRDAAAKEPVSISTKDVSTPNPDVPHTQAQVQQFLTSVREKAEPDAKAKAAFDARVWVIQHKILRPAGAMRTLPWKEDRGPNPFLLVTWQAGPQWEQGHFWDWLLLKQLPVLIEPLVKLLSPVIYFFSPQAGSLMRFYCLLVMLWTLLVWAFFGGAITRIAVVQVARQEKIGLTESVRFAARKYLSYLSAPLLPLVLVAILLVFMVLFGWLHMIPIFGDIVVDGVLWGLMILVGLAMAVVLVGLVGWPLMAATISAEGTDSWEAFSRSYSYVYQAPWQYIFYSLVALAYGAVIVFFIGLMGSLTVYLSKWGVSQTPLIDYANRNPTYLFVYAPESFGWRELLLQGATVDGQPLVENGAINRPAYNKLTGNDPNYQGRDRMWWYNQVGAVLVSIVWVGGIFMLVLGFGYSYFWSASSIIYLLMRRKVDDTELDEVYLEEEDDAAYAGPLAPKPAPAEAPAPAGPRPSLPIVEAPRPAAVSTPPPAPPPPAPAPGDEVAGAIHAAPPPAPPAPAPPGEDHNPPAGG